MRSLSTRSVVQFSLRPMMPGLSSTKAWKSWTFRRPVELEERAVAGRRVAHHDRRRIVVAAHDDAELALEGRVDRAADRVAAAGGEPFRGRLEERAGGLGIVLAFEEAEEAGPVAVVLVVEPVDDRGDTADDAAVPLARGTPAARRAQRRGGAPRRWRAAPRRRAAGRRPGRRGRAPGGARGTPPSRPRSRPGGPSTAVPLTRYRPAKAPPARRPEAACGDGSRRRRRSRAGRPPASASRTA